MHLPRRHLYCCALLLALLTAGLPASARGDGSGPAVAPPAEPDVLTARRGQPAPIDGLWCGTGLLHEFSLRLAQRYHEVQGSLARRDRVRTIEGRIDGATLRTQPTRVGSLVLEVAGDELRVTGGDGALALVRGAVFQRAAADVCSG